MPSARMYKLQLLLVCAGASWHRGASGPCRGYLQAEDPGYTFRGGSSGQVSTRLRAIQYQFED